MNKELNFSETLEELSEELNSVQDEIYNLELEMKETPKGTEYQGLVASLHELNRAQKLLFSKISALKRNEE
jgi:hypothetical protein